MNVDVGGIIVRQGHLNADLQLSLLKQVRGVVKIAPLFRPETARGKKMSVRMTSAGEFGWVSDVRGYRYERRHPNGANWPPIPDIALDVWKAVSGVSREPQSCLINFYDGDAKMGMHQDRDEADIEMPVVSISLGDQGLLRVGGAVRGGKTQSLWLTSGDVAVMGGDARMHHHGIDRIRAGSSKLLPKGGRINLTLRVVD